MSFDLTNLGEFATVQGGFAYKSQDFIVEQSIPVLKIKNVRHGFIDYVTQSYVSNETARSTAKWFTEPGDILISMTGSGPSAPESLVGRVARVWEGEPRALINQRVGRLRLKEEGEIDADFLFFVLSQKESQDYLVANSTGSANQVNISSKTIEAVPCPRISFAESKEVAAFLKAFEQRIRLLRETNATLEAIAQALFKSWFVDFDPVRAKMEGRAPEGMDETTAALFPDGLEESQLGAVPRGWRVTTFGEFVQRLSVGKKFDQKTASIEGAVPVLDQGKSGVIGYHNEAPGVLASLDKPVVVFANHTCYMRLICYDFSAIQNVLPFVGKGVDTVWAYFATKGRINFSEYKGHWPDFSIEKTMLPDEKLTECFREVVDSLIRRTRMNEVQAQTLVTLRDTLLPRLISGQLRLPEAQAQIEEFTA